MLFDREEWARAARDKANTGHILKKNKEQKVWGSVGGSKEAAPAVWSHHILAQRDQFAFPKNKQNGHSSAVSSSWKHPQTTQIEGVDKTPTCAHTALTALHTFIIKKKKITELQQNCPVL